MGSDSSACVQLVIYEACEGPPVPEAADWHSLGILHRAFLRTHFDALGYSV